MFGLRGRGFNSSGGDWSWLRGGEIRGEEVNAEFFSCSFNYFNYAPGFSALMHMSVRYSRARIRFSIRIYPYRMSKQVGESMDRICPSQLSTRRKNSICPYSRLGIDMINHRFKISRSISFSSPDNENGYLLNYSSLPILYLISRDVRYYSFQKKKGKVG